MLPLQYTRQWRAVSILLLISVLVFTLMPPSWFWQGQGKTFRWPVHIDKWQHGLTFAFLAVWFAGQYTRQSYWRIAAGLLAFGLLIEVCQRMVEYRSADLLDVGANIAGIAVGLVFALMGLGGWALRFEAWLAEPAR